MQHKCPICYRIIKASPQDQSEKAKFFPFCSDRCRLIDLGIWLDAEYKIISDVQPQESAEPPDTSSHAPADKQ